MSEKDILQKIKRSINKAPVNILDNIKAAPKTKMIKHDHITRQVSFYDKFKEVIPYTSVAVIFLVAFLGLQIQAKTPDSLVYLDVNPSVNFTTNKKDKVIKVQADNLDGQKIIDKMNFKGKNMEEVTAELLDRMIEENYLVKNNNYVLLSVYNKNGEKEEVQTENLNSLIHKHLRENNIRPIVLAQKLNKTDMIKEFADNHKISESKMTFIKKIINLDSSLKKEDLAKLSLAELIELINENDIKIDKIIQTNDIKRIEKQKKNKTNIYKDDRDEDEEDEDEDD